MSNSNTDQTWNPDHVWKLHTKIFNLWMNVATKEFQWFDERLVPYGPSHSTEEAAVEWGKQDSNFRPENAQSIPLTDRPPDGKGA
jgi:hypothetical protein